MAKKQERTNIQAHVLSHNASTPVRSRSQNVSTPTRSKSKCSGESSLSRSNMTPSPDTVACKSLIPAFDKLDLRNTSPVRYDNLYKTVKVLSKTILGNMATAINRKNNKIRAVKKFNKVKLQRRRNISRGESFHVELKLMTWLRANPHEGLIAACPEHEQVDDLTDKYIVMPFASHGDLLSYIDKHGGKVSDDVVRDIFLQLVSALQYLHQTAGYLHGDISPENILVSYDETGRLRVQLCDYGLACKIGSRHHCHGKKSYMAPEHYSNQPPKAKPSADIFSLAAVMFVLYYGKPAFETARQTDVHYSGLEHKCHFRASAYSSWLRAWGYSKKRCDWALLPTILTMLQRNSRKRPTLKSIKETLEGWKHWA